MGYNIVKKISLNLRVSLVYQTVAMICGFVLPRLILEQFGSDINGLIKSIAQFLGIINFLDMGVGQVVRSALYQPLEKQDIGTISKIMVSGRKFYRGIAYTLLGYVALLILVYPFIVEANNYGWFFIVGLISTMAISSFIQYYFGVTQELLLHANQQSYLVYSVLLFCNLLNLFLCVFLIHIGCSIHILKLTTACVFLIKPLFCVMYVRRKYPVNWETSYDDEPITQKWNGIAQHVSAVVLDGTDIIVLTFLTTLTNVSIYSVYYMIIGSIQTFYQSVVTSIHSAAGAIWARQNYDEIKNVFSITELCLHVVTVFLYCCMGMLIMPFVQVYTNGLTDANYIQPSFAVILVLAYSIRSLRTPYNIWILAAGHFKQTQLCHITAAALNIIVSVLTVFHWGLVGVAIGTLIAMCYQTCWMALYTTQKLVKISIFFVIKQFFVDIAMVVAIYISTSWIVLNEVSYLAWFLMALEVAVIALACIMLLSFFFYKSTLYKFGKMVKRKYA